MGKWKEKRIANAHKWSGLGSTGRHDNSNMGQGRSFAHQASVAPRLKSGNNVQALTDSIAKQDRRIERQRMLLRELKRTKGNAARGLRDHAKRQLVKYEAIRQKQVDILKAINRKMIGR